MSLLSTIASLQPKVVLTAPDGNQLWIDPVPAGDGDGASLWPAGFKLSLKFGPTPAADPAVTDSPPAFLASQTPPILALPGPLGVPIGLYALAAFIGGLYLIKKCRS